MGTGPFTVRQNQYVYLKGAEMGSLTLAVDEALWGDYEETFAAIAMTFNSERNDPFVSAGGVLSSPTLEVGSRSLDEFEHPDMQIYADIEMSGSMARCEYESHVTHGGNCALWLSYDVIPDGNSSGVRLYFPEGDYADFSAAQGISFCYRSFLPDQVMNFFIRIGDAGTTYSVAFTTSEESTREWVQGSFGFDEFGLPVWLEEASEPFDLTRVKSCGCEPARGERPVSAVLWVDDVWLILVRIV